MDLISNLQPASPPSFNVLSLLPVVGPWLDSSFRLMQDKVPPELWKGLFLGV